MAYQSDSVLTKNKLDTPAYWQWQGMQPWLGWRQMHELFVNVLPYAGMRGRDKARRTACRQSSTSYIRTCQVGKVARMLDTAAGWFALSGKRSRFCMRSNHGTRANHKQPQSIRHCAACSRNVGLSSHRSSQLGNNSLTSMQWSRCHGLRRQFCQLAAVSKVVAAFLRACTINVVCQVLRWCEL